MSNPTSPIDGSSPRVIKKYPNRRLYDTATSSYITLAEVKQLVMSRESFEVRDAKTSELCAPYVYYKWPDNAGGNATGAIIAKETLLKAEPAANSATLAALSYDLVSVIDWEVDDKNKASPQKWVKLKAGAQEGYVAEEHVRSPLEYRACFVNSGSRWRLIELDVGE